MSWIADRLRPGNWPWTVKAYAFVVLASLALTWAVTKAILVVPIAIFTVFYLAISLLFILSRNDWLRFAITGFHLVISGMIIYLVIFVIPGYETSALYPYRVALILGTSVLVTLCLWHPATGRWVHSWR